MYLRCLSGFVPRENIGDFPASGAESTDGFQIAVVDDQMFEVARSALRCGQDHEETPAVGRELGRRVQIDPSVGLAQLVLLQ